ncbi:MAG: hypothetical protein Q8Q08_09200 [Candidatus Omnitrophota bacterium]|nr:hypothetical protein [Candidatus Omnitrophota bacterium]
MAPDSGCKTTESFSEQTAHTAQELFFLFPEKPELAQEGAENDQGDLIQRKNKRKIYAGLQPEGGLRCHAKKRENRAAAERDRHPGQGKNQKDHHHIPVAFDSPFPLQTFQHFHSP